MSLNSLTVNCILRNMIKLREKIAFCFLILLITTVFSGCSILDGGALLNQNDTVVVSSPSPAPKPKGIGENYVSESWDFRLTDIVQTDSVGAEPYDEVAEEGNVILLLYLDVANISEVNTYFNNLFLYAKVDNKNAVQKILSTKNIEGREVAVGTIKAGETGRYFVAYEIPADWKEFEICYDDGGINTNKLADFKFKNKVE